MFATIKNLIPEPRQADQPRRYVGRHRRAEAIEVASTPVASGPVAPVASGSVAPVVDVVEVREEEAAAV